MPGEIKLYNEDCLEAMRKMPEGFFNLAIVDPPYGIGDFNMQTSIGNKRGTRKILKVDWNDTTPSPEYFKELRRVSKKQIVWGANYYNCFGPGGGLVWWKNIGHPNMSQCEIASCSFQKKVDYVHIPWASGFYREKFGPTIHPCQKPVDLYAWCLNMYAKQGDSILDTHLGSGSIAIACYDMGFHLTAFEINKDYYEAAVKRLENHKRQLTFI